jgi:hypothetical protein
VIIAILEGLGRGRPRGMITPRQAAARLAALLPHDESPWRVALALAVGVFLSFTPFWGFQTLLALLVAWSSASTGGDAGRDLDQPAVVRAVRVRGRAEDRRRADAPPLRPGRPLGVAAARLDRRWASRPAPSRGGHRLRAPSARAGRNADVTPSSHATRPEP